MNGRLAPNREAAVNCEIFLARCRAFPNPQVLIVGGGGRGSGTEALYAARDIRLVGTDVYASPDVEIIADGHRLPFADASFQGVWVQAVLEHVVAPERVVAEIARVLVDGGMVYAETPFLQPVHERAYDFTRYTRSGHRWLFRRFAAAQGPLEAPRAASALAVGVPHQMTTRKKVVLLVGAAALYYLYRRHQAHKAGSMAGQQAPQGQPVYYLSRNGQVYFRDATARVHWVTPPPQGIQVPSDEAQGYQGLQGYAGSRTGETNLSRYAARSGGM